ncbi:F0F1 ATP synthase subunit B [Saccharibacter sp. 17.LH.SD]|uniref:F0F1 ATP synthase subunit B family protein n=1 Tax=Saccharibacter sp. 17.LH.SD TaxID=2689393 RepID=UPI0013717D94|nr:F0F1 ATP synthase subunit B [Saccharibacter sp. 17.LH.SD]MXV45110.1 F0F1 ATP synthase subunit B [Saccharibacter sp. 17.LH.SD]
MFHEPRFWTSLAFILFFVIFGRKIWLIVASKLDDRANMIRGQLDEATRLRREAEQLLESANREREHALEEAQQLIAASKAEAEALKQRTAREANELIARHEKQARDRIQAAERIALREIRHRAADLAIAATRDVVQERLTQDPGLAKQLLDTGLNDLSKALRREAA